eukprot:7767387-Lingulodinium_polyedra.AAC.1
MSTEFVLVPKSNFGAAAGGASGSGPRAPECLQEWLVDEAELRAIFKVPEDTNFAPFWICDGN